eukprot:364288-Chlamydomonas_euryale.AAC.4
MQRASTHAAFMHAAFTHAASTLAASTYTAPTCAASTHEAFTHAASAPPPRAPPVLLCCCCGGSGGSGKPRNLSMRRSDTSSSVPVCMASVKPMTMPVRGSCTGRRVPSGGLGRLPSRKLMADGVGSVAGKKIDARR